MPDTVNWFVGLDWGSEAHAICLRDRDGVVRDEQLVAHRVEAMQAWLDRLMAQTGGPPGTIAVAIEMPRGLLVETLLERGFAVWAINPKQLDRFRDRWSVAGAKDDRRDASVLSESLRTDQRAFRRVQLDDPRILELRELTRADEDATHDLARFTNRLREQVARIAPAVLRLCPAADEPWFWTLLERTVVAGRSSPVSRADVARVLKAHRIRRLTADEVWAQVRARDFVPAPGVIAGVEVRLGGFIAHARLAHAQQQRCRRGMDRLLDALTAPDVETEPGEHRDAEILSSLPGVGRLITATMLTEATRPLADRDYHTLRCVIGIAPVTKRSGKRRQVLMRRACNSRLRQAAYHWGRNSILHDVSSRQLYDQQRQRGHSHGRALRAVVDRWLRILTAMLTHRTLYDPTRFAATRAA